MTKLICSFMLLISTAFACNESDYLSNTCSVANPVEDLDWLKKEIHDLEESDSDLSSYFYVSQASYSEETVFIFNNCCPNCNTVIPVKDCDGQVIGYLGYSDDDIHPNAIENDVIIWKPKTFSCMED